MTGQKWKMTIEMDERRGEVVARTTLVAGSRTLTGRGRAAAPAGAGDAAGSLAARRSLDDLAVRMSYVLEAGHLDSADQA